MGWNVIVVWECELKKKVLKDTMERVEKEILDERGREFYLERKRWPDLLRFHYEGVIDVYEEVPNLKNKKDQGTIIPLYCAIPLSDLDRNHNLTQTEGYENL